MPIDLCKEKESDVEVHVWAEIRGECLRIAGQDIRVIRSGKTSDAGYKYSYMFDEQNTQKLYGVLSIENDGALLMNLVVKNFSGLNGCKNLRKLCADNNITYSYSIG